MMALAWFSKIITKLDDWFFWDEDLYSKCTEVPVPTTVPGPNKGTQGKIPFFRLKFENFWNKGIVKFPLIDLQIAQIRPFSAGVTRFSRYK